MIPAASLARPTTMFATPATITVRRVALCPFWLFTGALLARARGVKPPSAPGLGPVPAIATSPGLIIAGRGRAGSGAAGGGWPPAGAHRSGAAGQPPCVGECTAEQEFDLGVGAAQLVAGPLGQGVVDGRVQPQQDALAFGHRGSVPAVTGRGCRC